MNNFKLLQLVVFACTCLLLLKSAAFVFSGGSVLTGTAELNAQEAGVKSDTKAGQKKAAEKNPTTNEDMMGPVPQKEQKNAD
ncbi:unnamed protein product, partial [Scytosiphon promiscuus]